MSTRFDRVAWWPIPLALAVSAGLFWLGHRLRVVA
jgi:hypothetical protein